MELSKITKWNMIHSFCLCQNQMVIIYFVVQHLLLEQTSYHIHLGCAQNLPEHIPIQGIFKRSKKVSSSCNSVTAIPHFFSPGKILSLPIPRGYFNQRILSTFPQISLDIKILCPLNSLLFDSPPPQHRCEKVFVPLPTSRVTCQLSVNLKFEF